jgi:hypothetical protein
VDPRASTYVPLASRGALAKGLLLLAVASDAAAAFTSHGLLKLAQAMQEARPLALAEIDAAESRHALATTIQIAIYVAAGIAFVHWFHGAYANLPALGVERLGHPTAWAVGAWLIPVVSLFWPKRIADEIWRGSDPETPTPREARVTPLYGAWWRTFVVAGILVLIGSTLWRLGQMPLELELAALLQLVGNLLAAASGVLAYAVVDRTTLRQEARAARLADWRVAPQV